MFLTVIFPNYRSVTIQPAILASHFYYVHGEDMNFKDKNCFPNELIALAKISKNDVLDKLGTDVFKKVVYDVLTGKAYLPLSRQDCSLEVSERNQGTDCEWTLL